MLSDQESQDRPAVQPQSGEPSAPGPVSQPRKAKALSKELVQRVLEEALVASESAEPVGRSDLVPLLEVARRHRGEPFCLHPVSEDLVETVLLNYFKGWSSSPHPWRNVSVEIAKSLYQDPVSHERLKALWLQLLEVS